MGDSTMSQTETLNENKTTSTNNKEMEGEGQTINSDNNNDNQSNVGNNFTKNIVRDKLNRENSLTSMTSVTAKLKDYQEINKTMLNNNNPNKAEAESSSIWQTACPCFRFLTKPKDKNNGDSVKKMEMKKVLSEIEQFSCELEGNSEIMKPLDIANISNHIPPRAIGFKWILTFSTSLHGFSLHNLYRKMYKVDSPTLLVIEDVKHRVFGALVSCALKVSENFYGTSQSFLFQCQPEFNVYKWNGENFYFVQGQEDSLCFGSGNGKFGIWLDSDLNKGRTEECATYGSPALVEEKDFIVKTLECWTFG